jgi:RNA polymerase primary sigma factor
VAPQAKNGDDSVGMYLGKIRGAALLTREREVEIGKRIEAGEKEVVQAVFASPYAMREIIDVGKALRARKIRVKAIIDETDEDGQQDE